MPTPTSRLALKWKSETSLPFTSSRSLQGRAVSTSLQQPGLDTHKSAVERITDLLFSGNLNLLLAVCQSSFAGESAHFLAAAIIRQLLHRQGRDTVEGFIARLLRYRISVYATKRKKLEDVLRDNSMTSLIIITYARTVGDGYLRQTLEPSLKEAMLFLARTPATHSPTDTYPPLSELNSPSSPLSPSTQCPTPSTANNPPSLPLHANEEQQPMPVTRSTSIPSKVTENHITASSRILQSILHSQTLAPTSFLRLCASVHTEVQRTPITAVVESQPEEIRPGSASSLSRRRTINHSPASNSPTVLKTILQRAPFGRSLKLMFRQSIDVHPPASNSQPSLTVGQASTSNPPHMQAVSQRQSHESVQSSSSLPGSSSTSIGPSCPEHQLTLAERVLGTLIFLRFFVPIITAPEQSVFYSTLKSEEVEADLKQQKKTTDISEVPEGGRVQVTTLFTALDEAPAKDVSALEEDSTKDSKRTIAEDWPVVSSGLRKDLIQCSKLLNGFCSEVESRHRDLRTAQFLDHYRADVKHFLHSLGTSQTVPGACSEAATPLPPKQITDQPEEEDALESLEDDAWTQILATSLSRLEKDVSEFMQQSETDESAEWKEGVSSQFRLLQQALCEISSKSVTSTEDVGSVSTASVGSGEGFFARMTHSLRRRTRLTPPTGVKSTTDLSLPKN